SVEWRFPLCFFFCGSFPRAASKPHAELPSARPRSPSRDECGSFPSVPSHLESVEKLQELPRRSPLAFPVSASSCRSPVLARLALQRSSHPHGSLALPCAIPPRLLRGSKQFGGNLPHSWHTAPVQFEDATTGWSWDVSAVRL